MAEYLFKGILIGLIFGIPAGAVGALTVQRAISGGFRAGIFTGMGSSAADVFYASVGAFGITFVSDFIMKNQTVIYIVGGLFIAAMGAAMLLKSPKTAKENAEIKKIPAMFFSSLAVGITNPSAVLSFVFAFSVFDISGGLNASNGVFLVLGVFIGTMLWWTALSGITVIFRNKLYSGGMKKLNIIFGIILTIFAVSVIIKAFTN